MSQVAFIDTIRTLAFGSITGSFVAIGTPVTNAVRIICITNNTDGDLFLSNDGLNNKIFVAASSYKLYDICSNADASNGAYLLPALQQWYVKQSTAPSKGAVYLEVFYGSP